MRAVLVLLLVCAGCTKKGSEGLPPATDWEQGGGAAAGGMMPSTPQAADPHAGVPGAPDLSGGGTDPHAGVPGAPDISGGNGPDVTQLGLESPDPSRPIDPSRRIRGTLKVHAKAKARMKDGVAVFLVVKRAGPDGQPTGTALAVDKVSWRDGLAFELTERQAMVAGTELSGEVIVTARYDQDADAISRQSGDVTGQTRVKVPADGVVLELDTVLP